MNKKDKQYKSKFSSFLEDNNLLITIIVSFTSLLISLYTIYLNNKAEKNIEERINKESIPQWSTELVRNTNNIDLLKIKFLPINPNIKLEKIVVTPPNDFIGPKSFKSQEGTLKMSEFQSSLMATLNDYFKLPMYYNLLDPSYSPLDESYPLVINLKYLKYGEIHDQYILYKLSFTIFTSEKIRINDLEFVKEISNSSDVSYELDKYNSIYCIGMYRDSPDAWAYLKKERKWPTLVNVVDSAFNFIAYNFIQEKNNEYILTITLPKLLADSLSVQKIVSNMKLVREEYNLPKETTRILDDIDEFIKEYPAYIDSFNPHNCKWRFEDVRLKWKILFLSLKNSLIYSI